MAQHITWAGTCATRRALMLVGSVGAMRVVPKRSLVLLIAFLAAMSMSMVIVGNSSATSSASRVGYWLAASTGTVNAYGEATPFTPTSDQRLNGDVVGIASTPGVQGYWLVTSKGKVYSFGGAKLSGSMAGKHLDRSIVGIAVTPSGRGYWLVGGN